MNRRDFFRSVPVGVLAVLAPTVTAAFGLSASSKEYTGAVSDIRVHRYRSSRIKQGNLYSTHWWGPIDFKDLKPGMEILTVNRPGHRLMVHRGPIKRYPLGIYLEEYTGPDAAWWSPRRVGSRYTKMYS